MGPPGGLDKLGEAAAAAWRAHVAAVVSGKADALSAVGKAPIALGGHGVDLPDVRAPDWPGFPARVAACVGRENSLRLFDWRPEREGDLGRVSHQEEYLEWRLQRRPDGSVGGVEFTTEFQAYWEVLAAHEPQLLVRLINDFVGRTVEAHEPYGGRDPSGLSSEERLHAFQLAMTPGPDPESDPRGALARVSPLNNGLEGMCFMIQPFNTLGALVGLAVSAARPVLVRDPLTNRTRHASGSEAIVALDVAGAAQDGRNSDPLVVERVTALAADGQRVGFDDPIGVYIRGFQRSELLLDDGSEVPANWLDWSRGLSARRASDGRPRFQRLTLTIPDDMSLSDLVVRRTGQPVRFGGQLAALTQLAVYLRSGPSAEAQEVEPVPAPTVPAPNCTNEAASFAQMQEEAT